MDYYIDEADPSTSKNLLGSSLMEVLNKLQPHLFEKQYVCVCVCVYLLRKSILSTKVYLFPVVQHFLHEPLHANLLKLFQLIPPKCYKVVHGTPQKARAQKL